MNAHSLDVVVLVKSKELLQTMLLEMKAIQTKRL